MSRRVWVTRLSKPAGLAPSRKSSCAGRERERERRGEDRFFSEARARPGQPPRSLAGAVPFFWFSSRSSSPRPLSLSLSPSPPLPHHDVLLDGLQGHDGLAGRLCVCVGMGEQGEGVREKGRGGTPRGCERALRARAALFFSFSALGRPHRPRPSGRPDTPTTPRMAAARSWVGHSRAGWGGGGRGGAGCGEGGEKERASERAKKSKPCRSSALGSLRARARALPSPLLHIHVVLQDFRDHVVVRVLVRGGGHGCQFVGGWGGGREERRAGGKG
jgi:hypothetical protein